MKQKMDLLSYIALNYLIVDIPLPPGGVRVRVGNLPKKRNIQRDLQLAFKAFPGIIKIHPAITGSKKTRDPVCKGFAFLDLASQKAAER